MDQNSFWLADISDQTVTISLITLVNGNYQISSIGPAIPYQDNNNFVAAVDQSLSKAASYINLSESDEPDNIALIISPFWIGSDGRIISERLAVFNQLFKELKLKPMGFIANDEAILEEANQSDGFPASFILVNFSDNDITVSLTYLGKVTERITKPIIQPFDPNLLESILLDFNSDSTLPPQIILIGETTVPIIESVKNFSWIGKKSVETFLHFPDIKSYDLSKVTGIYLKAITSQFQPSAVTSQEFTKNEDLELETLPEVVITKPSLIEVDASDLGFTVDTPVESPPEVIIEKVSPKIVLPKINLPKLKLSFPSSKFFLFPLVFSPLLVLIPFFFSRANVTLYLTPYDFSKTFNATFDSAATEIDQSKGIIPVNRKSIEVNNSVSSATTGNKTVGEKSVGEAIVYNKQDKVQSLSKGTVLTDSAGRKYELTTSAQIASSSANLDLGVINLGQTKVMVSATDIGPEYNLNKDAKLVFKDFPETVLVAKVSQGLSGGTKQQISAVSATDKANLEQQLNTKISVTVDSEVAKELAKTPGVIKDSVQVKNSRPEYNREVGEEAQELTATSISTIYIFYLNPDQKSLLLSTFLSSEPGFLDSKYSLDDFTITISNPKKTIDQIQGSITISGKSITKLNTLDVAKLLAGKSQSSAGALIKKSYPRVYNYQIDTNFSFLKFINPLPFRLQNIKIEVK